MGRGARSHRGTSHGLLPHPAEEIQIGYGGAESHSDATLPTDESSGWLANQRVTPLITQGPGQTLAVSLSRGQFESVRLVGASVVIVMTVCQGASLCSASRVLIAHLEPPNAPCRHCSDWPAGSAAAAHHSRALECGGGDRDDVQRRTAGCSRPDGPTVLVAVVYVSVARRSIA